MLSTLLKQFSHESVHESKVDEAHLNINALKLGKFVDIFRSSIVKGKLTKPSNKTNVGDKFITTTETSLNRLFKQIQNKPTGPNGERLVGIGIYSGATPIMLINVRDSVDDSTKWTSSSKCIVGYDFTSLDPSVITEISSGIEARWGTGSINTKSDFKGEIRSSITLEIIFNVLEKSVSNANAKLIYVDTKSLDRLQQDRKEQQRNFKEPLHSRLSKFKATKAVTSFKKGQEAELLKFAMNVETSFGEATPVEYDGEVFELGHYSIYSNDAKVTKSLTGGKNGAYVELKLKARSFMLATTAKDDIILEFPLEITLGKAVVRK